MSKRFMPYKRQNTENVTTSTIFFGTTSMVGEISTIIAFNQTVTVFVAQNSTFGFQGTATGGNSIPLILPTGSSILPTGGGNGTLGKRFFNAAQLKFYEPTTTTSSGRKSFITLPSTVQGSTRPTTWTKPATEEK